VPTASLCTTPFIELAHRQAEGLGLPSLPIVHIPQRLADRSWEELEGLVDDAIDDICAAVTVASPEVKAG
jgi:hypothetical protein